MTWICYTVGDIQYCGLKERNWANCWRLFKVRFLLFNGDKEILI